MFRFGSPLLNNVFVVEKKKEKKKERGFMADGCLMWVKCGMLKLLVFEETNCTDHDYVLPDLMI